MIYRIPENWIYNESLEMLYLFYQKADELLSETSPDTYSLPLHNSMTLLIEAEEIFEATPHKESGRKDRQKVVE